ncbi:MBL fold metallo-hydrolase [Hydrogenobacter hydrogenophilus]|uniref:Glyoxylase, beta-lactamase superfamily II n=1 Tax=Hydrogenobacter hydrogenophilus TaxID=35835 RepID=A0A285NWD5_9AQUI|nr:MBL fold metallo-hydrolase [Hydrogenobacter hydrogenophilus]SNZ11951.1 Glyoxylase, beta-lactamase superfamily II [Hydrogenobacter hydrogenophilus]
MRALAFLLLLFVFGLSKEMNLKKVEDNIYMVRGVDELPSLENKGFVSNAYAILTKEGWVVIDTLSTPELSKKLLEQMYRVKKAPVKYAIITHYHPDHWYGAQTFKDVGAKIIAHRGLYELYKSGMAKSILEEANKNFGGLYKSVLLVEPDIVVDDYKKLKVGSEEFEIISMTPAHTNSDIVVYMPKRKVLFAGDLVYQKRIPFMADRNASSKGWEEALKKMKNMDIRIILGGHNDPMDKSAIDYTLGYITYLRQNIKKMKEEGKFIDEIKTALQDSPYKSDAMYGQFHNANIFKVDSELDLEP